MIGNGSPLKPLSFSQQSTFGSPSSPSASFLRPSVAPQRSGLSSEYQAPSRRTFQAPDESDDEEYSAEMTEEDDQQYNENLAYIDDDAEGMTDDDAQYDDDEAMDFQSENPALRPNGRAYDQRSSSDLLLSTPGALRRSREGGILGGNDYLSQSLLRPKESIFGSIAKDLYARMPPPQVTESDDLVLNTESIITRLYEQGIGASEEEDKLQEALMVIPSELVNLWEDYDRNTRVYDSEEYTTAIGPGPKATNFQKSNYVAGLALQIHHPQKEARSFGTSRVKPLPQVMLEWLDDHHNVFPSYLEEVQHHRPSPSNSRLFWSTLFNSLIRGKIVAVVNLLTDAGWRHARNDSDVAAGQYGDAGFSGAALQNVEKVARDAVKVFELCPAAHGDWNIRGSEWTLFRLRISQAMEDLKSYAEGNSRDRPESNSYGRSSFAGQSGIYSKTAQKAESKVPWHIYQNMVTLYSIAMGDANAIVEVCGDWVEAAAGLLVWWDEGKDDRRQALNRSQNTYRASLRGSDMEYYLHKLRKSFETAIDKTTDFAVNTADELEVSLASLFEGDNEAVVGFLRGWSGPVSSAVAEVASLAGWLPQVEPQSLINIGSLDQEDLDLLGVNSSPSRTDGVKDLTLITYAKSLTHRGQLGRSTSSGPSQEGWELAIAILGRLDSATRSEEIVGEFLQKFPLASTTVVDKLWKLLNETGMGQHAESVAEVRALLGSVEYNVNWI
jgi:Nup85 Nucleoporin